LLKFLSVLVAGVATAALTADASASWMFQVWRLGKGPAPYWRLATTAEEKALVKKGWHLDGLVGFVFARA
jgi:hypothetical protein